MLQARVGVFTYPEVCGVAAAHEGQAHNVHRPAALCGKCGINHCPAGWVLTKSIMQIM